MAGFERYPETAVQRYYANHFATVSKTSIHLGYQENSTRSLCGLRVQSCLGFRLMSILLFASFFLAVFLLLLLPIPLLHLILFKTVVGVLRFVFDITNRACPLLFIVFLCLFLSLWPFQLYFIP